MNLRNNEISLPKELKERLLEGDNEFGYRVMNSIIDFFKLIKINEQPFFPEYTEHGIEHIKSVLEYCVKLIPPKILSSLSSEEAGIIVLSVVLHDIGMQATEELFYSMMNGEYDFVINENYFKDKPWKLVWEDYFEDCKHWSAEKKARTLGDPNINIVPIELKNLSKIDKLLIGEFIRIHHSRIAYEVALRGYIATTKDGEKKKVCLDRIDFRYRLIAGIVARSHGMKVRETYDILKAIYVSHEEVSSKSSWTKPCDIPIIFFMILVRLSDYLDIDNNRTDKLSTEIHAFSSQYSLGEHFTHLSVDKIAFRPEIESIFVTAEPKTAAMYVKIKNLINDIQYEFDLSWAILGECYLNEFALMYRRVQFHYIHFKQIFVPKQFSFRFNNELAKNLIIPLYGNNPSYGVRELLQNAVDACRMGLAKDANYNKAKPITLSLDSKSKIFTIKDFGVGMSIEEIEKYFLTIGSSINTSVEWEQIRREKCVYRTGRFGIGVLAAFLLGNRITVETKSKKDEQGYEFTASLQDNFIQINKINKNDYGTTIRVECSDFVVSSLGRAVKNYLLSLERNLSIQVLKKMILWEDPWFAWYIDEVPRVEYYMDAQLIPKFPLRINGYKKLKHSLCNFGDVYWEPIPILKQKEESRTRDLFCNGFFITNLSNKNKFSIIGLKNYMNPQIPSLSISDINNELPLNLQRDNIDEDVRYDFELDLAKDIYKDYLCQMLALDLSKYSDYQWLFFNSVGYTFNKSPNYPFSSYNQQYHSYHEPDLAGLYSEKCLHDKTIVHICPDNFGFINLSYWIQLFRSFPNVFFSFYNLDVSVTSNEGELDFLGRIIDKINTAKYFNNMCVALCEDWDHRRESIYYYPILHRFVSNKKHCIRANNYYIVGKEKTKRNLASNIIETIHNLGLSESTLFFIMHDTGGPITGAEIEGLFNELEIGDMIVPYERRKRRKKYAMIYNEFSEDIENYKHWYNKKKKKDNADM